MENPRILIVHFGSQYTELIEQRLREAGYRSAVLPPKQAEVWIKNNRPKAIILSGSRYSVNDPAAPTISPKIFEAGVPILGICYGMQLIANMYDGLVVKDTEYSDYGTSQVKLKKSILFSGLPDQIDVLASHGDSVKLVPTGFRIIACDETNTIAAMEDKDRCIWGLQFHPESQDTPRGRLILENFVSRIAACEKDWKPEDMIAEISSNLKSSVGDGRSIIGFSGGVDSTTLSVIAGTALGSKLKAYCIDGNQLREGELDDVRANAGAAKVELEIIDAKDEFARLWNGALQSEYNSETKRSMFKVIYELCLARAAVGCDAMHFIQGTLAPDMIESGQTGGDCIKTHHNIGVQIDSCESLHPFKHLFKYEVRALAEKLGLPKSIVMRKPFPGPGLFVRVSNGYPTPERIETVRWADARVNEIVDSHPVSKEISQLVVALDCGQFVGVKGDERSYAHPIIIHAVKTLDFMTAEVVPLPHELWQTITKMLTKHPRISRVFADMTPKPPSTIEME